MKSFKDYASTQTEAQKDTASAEELTRRIASAYHGKSNADMFRNILAEAERSKRAGTLTNEEIENFYRTFSPMLDSAQKKRLRAVVERIKSI